MSGLSPAESKSANAGESSRTSLPTWACRPKGSLLSASTTMEITSLEIAAGLHDHSKLSIAVPNDGVNALLHKIRNRTRQPVTLLLSLDRQNLSGSLQCWARR